jgi:hypothetical protein
MHGLCETGFTVLSRSFNVKQVDLVGRSVASRLGKQNSTAKAIMPEAELDPVLIATLL